MKASKILAGLSAVALAASMLSMVAASADETDDLTRPGAEEGGVPGYSFTEGNTEFDDEGDLPADTGEEAKTETEQAGGTTENVGDADSLPYPVIKPYPAVGPFPGFPGYGVPSFPVGWYWFNKDDTFEVWGQKDTDVCAPGYLVFEFDNGERYVVDASVDQNGTFTTADIHVPYMGVNKIYFEFEISEAPYFALDLNSFSINGKAVELDKDNMAPQVLNPTDGSPIDIVNDGSENVDVMDENNGNIGIVEDTPAFYYLEIFNKYNTTDSVIDHGLIIWGTTVKVTYTVSNIGKVMFPNNGHEVLQPSNEANEWNSINSRYMFTMDDADQPTRSADIYDYLLKVYNSDKDHKSDAVIKFKTYADKEGILVAHFLNVWGFDLDSNGDQIYVLKNWVDASQPQVVKKSNVIKFVDESDASGNPVYVNLKTGNLVTCVGYSGSDRIYNDNGTQLTQLEILNDTETYGTSQVHQYNTFSYSYEETDADGKKITKTVTLPADGQHAKPMKDENGNQYVVYPLDPVSAGDVWVLKSEKPTVVDSNGNTWYECNYYQEWQVEASMSWHPFFLTENGLVDIRTRDEMGSNSTKVFNYDSTSSQDYKDETFRGVYTNINVYSAITEAQIEYLRKNNGMYYEDSIHSPAYGHFVVFGDNTLREYSYRIKAEAVEAIIKKVQRSKVLRDEYVQAQWGDDVVSVVEGYGNMTKTSVPNGKEDELDGQMAKHGTVWLQCCDCTRLYDVTVRAHTDIKNQDQIPSLYVEGGEGEEGYKKMYPTKPADSKAETAPAPTAGEAAADPNAESGAAAGFGIAGLLLAGAAMVCAKKKN